MENILIVGTGLTGCAFANKLLEKNIKYNILIIDKLYKYSGKINYSI
jgi:UDP-galactopyranose mutase